MSSLAAGRLRHRIEIRRRSRQKDGKGGYTDEWATIATPRAEVASLDGKEGLAEHVLQGVSSYRIVIRYREGIRTDDQVRHGALELNITSAADPHGTREQLVILATTAAALKAS
ncbi:MULTISPECIES: phage head closure protein [Sphingomonas]|uniref:Phage head closure protein n=1 Tax=Sphingomonas molluscorum TaxID=418184 RepID=A0ABU8Q7Q2_9SPHN|nr:phage head closure protein [Sphingomonas sp. JUb134]MBM7407059.1 SPP1 family predicted phage head-tail adaptor [Sphingomonas sp. JUb134]